MAAHTMVPTPNRLCLAALVGVCLTAAPVVAAFHDGGVASCGGCHVTHATEDGLPIDSGEALLRADTASDTCLLCHADGSTGVLGSSPLLPTPERGGGDFVFLYEDELNDATSAFGRPLGGHKAGHNVVAPGHGLMVDPENLVAPGGSFPSAALGCTSCHDPHGSGAYRLLHGDGPVQNGLYSFVNPAPDASGLELDGATSEGSARSTAYRSGWSAWCSNCHGPDVHGQGARFEHPVDTSLGVETADRYAVYAGDVSPDGGVSAMAYLAEVPFEDPNRSPTSTEGPSASSRLQCMSCHRAHASSAPRSGRWDFLVATLGDDGNRSGSYPLPNPYLDPQQRQLCVKCHDTEGHDHDRSCHQCHVKGRGSSPPPNWQEQ